MPTFTTTRCIAALLLAFLFSSIPYVAPNASAQDIADLFVRAAPALNATQARHLDLVQKRPSAANIHVFSIPQAKDLLAYK